MYSYCNPKRWFNEGNFTTALSVYDESGPFQLTYHSYVDKDSEKKLSLHYNQENI